MDVNSFIENEGDSRIVVISGAGLSAESGISTINDPLWKNININHVTNISNINHKYHKIHSFYNTVRVEHKEKIPNEMHHFIKSLEDSLTDTHFIHISTNYDDLYEKTGGTVMKLHGNIKEVIENYSMSNNEYSIVDVGYEPYIPSTDVLAKPNIFLLGEYERFVSGKRIPLYEERDKVLKSLTENDIVIIIGCGDEVIVWSELVGLGSKSYTININTLKSDDDWKYDLKMYNKCTQIIDKLADIINTRLGQ